MRKPMSAEHRRKVIEGLQRTQKIRSENSSKTWAGKKSETERFDDKFIMGSDDECWEWIAGKNKEGYGYFQPSKVAGKFPRAISAHRYAFQRANPGVLSEEIMHTCDNSKCVNPKHLKAGTHKENMEDYSKKYKAGLRKRITGKKYFNNGLINKFQFECPEGFVKGRL